jgi:hypothetical protein
MQYPDPEMLAKFNSPIFVYLCFLNEFGFKMCKKYEYEKKKDLRGVIKKC